MHPSSLAVDLEDQAAVLRRMAAGVRKSGRPIDVPWPHGSGRKTLHMMTSDDVEGFAEDLERDAKKLRRFSS